MFIFILIFMFILIFIFMFILIFILFLILLLILFSLIPLALTFERQQIDNRTALESVLFDSGLDTHNKLLTFRLLNVLYNRSSFNID